MTNTVLGLMGDKGASFEPLLRNKANPTVIRAGEQINVAPSKVEVELDGRLLPGYSPEDLISELVAISGGELELKVIRARPGSIGAGYGPVRDPEGHPALSRLGWRAGTDPTARGYRFPVFLQSGYTDVWLPADEAATGS